MFKFRYVERNATVERVLGRRCGNIESPRRKLTSDAGWSGKKIFLLEERKEQDEYKGRGTNSEISGVGQYEMFSR